MSVDVASPTRTRPAARISIAVGWAFVLVAATILQLLRQSGFAAWRTVWAEDGSVFFTGTRTFSQVFDGYAGYLQLVPRLLGFGAHALPLADLARYYAVGGALITTLCGVAVWYFAGQLVTSKLLRAVLALSVVLLPTLVVEQLANGVNTIWAITFAGWWAILYRPRSRRDAVPAAIVAFFAVTSNALVLVYAPVVAVLVWHRRDKPTFVVGAAFLTGTLVQLAVMLGSEGPQSSAASHVADLPEIYSVRVLGSAIVGERWVGGAWNALGVGFAVLAGLVVVTLVAVLVRAAKPRVRLLGLLTIAYSGTLWAISVYGRGTVVVRIPAAGYNSVAARWSSISIWLLMSGVFILASGLRPGTARRVVVWTLVAQFALVAVVGFRGTNGRSLGPSWSAALQDARVACLARGAAHSEVLVMVAPPAPDWAVKMACRAPSPRSP